MKPINRNESQTGGVFIPIQRESPKGRQHLHTMEAGAWLPFVQASLTGIILGVVILVCAFTWRWQDPWSWGAIIGALSWGITWMALQRHWFSLTALEEVTGLDLNRDGVIGENQGAGPAPLQPEDNPRIIQVRLNETRSNGHLVAQRRYEIHASDKQMAALAKGLIEDNRPFTVREWCGDGRPFSGVQFSRLRAEMMRAELLEMKSDKASQRGFVLTPAGEDFLTEFLTN